MGKSRKPGKEAIAVIQVNDVGAFVEVLEEVRLWVVLERKTGVLEDCMCSGRERGVEDDVMVVIGVVHNILVVFFSWHIVGLHFPPSLE